MHLHQLCGCAPIPLAHYLKALGILRLVAEQKDPTARGFWKDDAFCLVTRLDAEELKDFFLNDYAPTPVVAPWNSGSGFWPKDNKSGIEPLARAETPRFAAYREAIGVAREAFGGLKEAPKSDEKTRRVGNLRAALSSVALDWLDAALMVGDDALRYPALLGTGGNDGRLDFTNNFMQRLVIDLFDENGHPRDAAEELLGAALWRHSTRQGSSKFAIGQFIPSDLNSVVVGTPKNPWDFVLMIEGALLLKVSAVRRLEGRELVKAAAPFAVEGVASGYASASDADCGNGRGEQWLPLWSAPARLDEIKALFAEGRLKSGTKTVRQPIEAALAIRQLGAARGVTSFQRFGFIERNGKSFLSVPLERWQVDDSPKIRPLREIVDWCDRFRKTCQGKEGTAALSKLARDLETAVLDVCRESHKPTRWQKLLIRLGEAEDAVACRPKLQEGRSAIRPLPRLSAEWLRLADPKDPNDAEFYLARALASQFDARTQPAKDSLGSIRAHCLPLKGNSFDKEQSPRVLWRASAPLVDNLLAVLQRRLFEGQAAGLSHLALQSDYPARVSHIERFIDGTVDERRIAALARGLMAIRLSHPAQDKRAHSTPRRESVVLSPLHALFRLCLLRQPLTDDVDIPASAHVLRLLATGRLREAGTRALQHLGAHGHRPRLTRIYGPPSLSRRLAAALAFPLSAGLDAALLDAALKPDSQDDDAQSS